MNITPRVTFLFSLGLTLATLITPERARAQAPGAMSAPPAAPAPTSAAPASGAPKEGPLGNDIPMFDGGNNVVSWQGKHWNIDNQRLFRARLEKFLNAPEQTDADSKAYQDLLSQIMELLSPEGFKSKNLNTAWALLHKASNYQIDAHLCDSLADAVYATWLSKNEQSSLDDAQHDLDEQRSTLVWNAKIEQQDTAALSSPSMPHDKAAQQEWINQQKEAKTTAMAPYVQRLAEVNAMMLAAKASREASLIQSKIEFQSLLVQLFMQRRFQHVVMGTRFYRYLFGDGDTSLHISKETQNMFMQTSGMPPTLGVLDSLADESMRDVKEGVDAYLFLLDKKELASATERLGETFVLGEYMPELRNLSRDKKREALVFAQKENQLLSAIDVKDYELADKLTTELQKLATDFDASKPLAAIQTAKTVSTMHLAKAKSAASSGDQNTVETEIKAAMEIWPRNPDVAKISDVINTKSDVMQQALNDLDHLVSQHNYRQIFEDRVRFMTATSFSPDRQATLKKVLEQMQEVEEAITRSKEIAKHGDAAGAWEGVEKESQKFSDDPKLNQLRAQFTTDAATFVHNIKTAQDLEKKGETGSSLAWYLKSQRLYPESEYAQEGIERLVKHILPDAS